MSIEHVTDHQGRAVARLPEQFKQTVSIPALVRACTAQHQAIEDALWSLLSLPSIDDMGGAQLDLLGRLLGQVRDNNTDPEYRLALRARMLLNRSSGTVPELLALLRALVTDPAATFLAREGYPLGLTLRVGGVAVDDGAYVGSLVAQAHAGGVRVVFEWSPQTPASTFRFDSGPGFDTGHLSGATE